jgi:hypothetical protein
MEAVGIGLQTALLEPLLCTASLISDIISSVLKYITNTITRMLHKRPEIPITAREIHATIRKMAKCEVNMLQSGSKQD